MRWRASVGGALSVCCIAQWSPSPPHVTPADDESDAGSEASYASEHNLLRDAGEDMDSSDDDWIDDDWRAMPCIRLTRGVASYTQARGKSVSVRAVDHMHVLRRRML